MQYEYFCYLTHCDPFAVQYAVVYYVTSNAVCYSCMRWYHNIYGKALTTYNDNNVIEYTHYCINGELHNDIAPALIQYYASGQVREEAYYQHDKLHRDDGPATIGRLISDIIYNVQYYRNDKLHRDDGPAMIYYDNYGDIKSATYYIDGCITGTQSEI